MFYRPSTPPHLATLILLTGLSTLTLNMFLPALAQIADDLDSAYGTMTLAVGGYLALTAVVQLGVGPLADRLGRRPVLLCALAIFTLASVCCALAQDAATFLVARAAQAAAIGGYVLSLAIVRDITHEDAVAGRLATIASAMALAPLLGPILGGVIASAVGWRAIFWVYASAGAFLWIICLLDVGETGRSRRDLRGNVAGVAQGNTLTLLRAPRFVAHAGCAALSVGAFYVFLAGSALVATSQFDLSEAMLGVVIGSITVGFMIGSTIAARLSGRATTGTLMIAGRVIANVGLATGLVFWTLGLAHPLAYFGATICVGIGNGLTMPSANAGVMAVRPDLAATAAGTSGAATVLVGAALTTLAGRVLTETNAAPMLLLLMLVASGTALLAAIWAKRAPA
ncbi:MAG: MFS transporter [Pseudomonadota bacterium]